VTRFVPGNGSQLLAGTLVGEHSPDHEWWDGSGYPAKLSGKRIPIHARIVALARRLRRAHAWEFIPFE
jgi:hypothetical protein